MSPCIIPYKGINPRIHQSAFIAPTASVIGDVTIAEGSSLWFGSIVRGDVASIIIGSNTNIQDGSIIHVTRGGGNTVIGNNVTIGHKALLHACTLQDACFIGMGAIILDNTTIETGGMLAAGSLLTSHKIIRKGELWAGNPAKFFRQLTPEESAFILTSAKNYLQLAAEYSNN